jgi:hypothetical protein
MVIWDWQQFGFSRIQPFFPRHVLALGTVAVSAGIIRNPLGAAMITFFHMATEFFRSATQKIVDNLVMLREKREGILILSNVFP